MYGPIDAFNRTVLQNAHDVASSGHSGKIAIRPLSKKLIEEDDARNTFYPSLIKGPKDRVAGLKNMLKFRNTFANKFQL